jgi:hypothetical protein
MSKTIVPAIVIRIATIADAIAEFRLFPPEDLWNLLYTQTPIPAPTIKDIRKLFTIFYIIV